MSETFWDYCLQQYPRHEKQLLAWQDSHGLDVNLYLLAAWLDEEQLYLGQASWLALLAESRRLQAQLLDPFRSLRRALKAELDKDGYAELKTMELRLEKEAQRQYLALVARDPASAAFPEPADNGLNLPRLLAFYRLKP
ncbi:TIGR02444 family protein [Gallaecimonas sp. GXIMD4217]|uniref:TIGR02444 family protein n=1 Tax=Gallaecimonas sp. GXIMD4217 TaxID=3131927 RepID=UPI00311B1EEB